MLKPFASSFCVFSFLLESSVVLMTDVKTFIWLEVLQGDKAFTVFEFLHSYGAAVDFF